MILTVSPRSERPRAARVTLMVSVTHCPLTSIATAVRKAPDIAPACRTSCGCAGPVSALGPSPPAAGFNTCVDPAAARSISLPGPPLIVMPPDVTPKALTPYAGVEEIRSLRTPVGQPVASGTDVFEGFDSARYGRDGTPLHDPSVIACLLKHSLFQGRPINVKIETTSEVTSGMTMADSWRETGCAPNTMVTGGVDRDGFYRLLSERLGGCDS
ncbi:MAG: nucleoside hydrolase [Rhodobacter sp.]|nr:nucleoside hydrolase [Rhodobacter sp.]